MLILNCEPVVMIPGLDPLEADSHTVDEGAGSV